MSGRETFRCSNLVIKTCSKCKIQKSETFFGKDRSKKDGLTSSCKSCIVKRDYKRAKAGGNFTKAQKKLVHEAYNHSCQICGSQNNLEVDHKLPQIVCKPYAASVIENAWLLCKKCNTAKGSRILIEVIKDIPSKILEPMLLRKYQDQIKNKFFDKVIVKISENSFTEVRFKHVR